MKKENEIQTEILLDGIKQESSKIISAQKEEIEQLQHPLSDMSESIGYMEGQMERKAKEEARKKRLERISLPARDAAGYSELLKALDYVNSNSHFKVTATATKLPF